MTETMLAENVAGGNQRKDITRLIVEARGGRVGVESELGGSTFAVMLPLGVDGET